ncbi:MAG TPA: universal stress protein [Polyangia bacterium]|jgi:nucleotide-binding universal stress UspA family protein
MRIREIKLILVPTDFSTASDRALDVAMDLARLTGAAMEVLHVNLDAIWVLPPPVDLVATPVDMTDVLASSAIQLEAVVARVRGAGISCTGVSQTGRTDAEIVDYARTHAAGLIVVGSHGRHGLGHALLGSVAEKVVRHAPCPILVVPAAEGERPRVSSDEETPIMVPTEGVPA